MKVDRLDDVTAPSRKVCLDCRYLDLGSMGCRRAAGRKANAVRLNPSRCGPGAKLFQAKRTADGRQ